MSEILQEFVDSASQRLRVDRKGGVIRGVKLLGLRSRNGRSYREQALRGAISLYEGAKVNVNHPKGHPLSPRDYQDRLGVIRSVRYSAGEGLFGDLHFNPKHSLSEQLLWDAEHASQNVGLSHNVLARTSRQGEQTAVEAITKVQSIDLVADPATTQGLFEHQAQVETVPRNEDDSSEFAWDQLTVEHLRTHRPDLLDELCEQHQAQLETVRSQLDEATAREALARRRERIDQLLLEHNLPLLQAADEAGREIVSEHFLQELLDAASDDQLRRLVEERAALVRSAREWRSAGETPSSRPVSRDQTALTFGPRDRVTDAREFAAAISG